MANHRLFTDETGKGILATLQIIASKNPALAFENFEDVKKLMTNGSDVAKKALPVGTQLLNHIKIGSNTYDDPKDVVDYQAVTLADETVTDGIILKSHFGLDIVDMPFGNYEAFYHHKSDIPLPAGTYYITMGFNWGSNVVNGESFSFTLTQALPKNGVLCGFRNGPDTAWTNWKVYAYASQYAYEPTETCDVVKTANGTFIGTINTTIHTDSASGYTINTGHRVMYGNNRWKTSAMRQFLNSDTACNATDGTKTWWKAQTDFDMIPSIAKTVNGYMSLIDQDLKLSISKTKVVTSQPNCDRVSGQDTLDVTYDYFSLPALEQMNITQQNNGEGSTWEYYRLLSSTKFPWYTNTPELVALGMNSKAAVYQRLRSAHTGSGGDAWYVNPSGNVSNGYIAIYTNVRAFPACVIIE